MPLPKPEITAQPSPVELTLLPRPADCSILHAVHSQAGDVFPGVEVTDELCEYTAADWAALLGESPESVQEFCAWIAVGCYDVEVAGELRALHLDPADLDLKDFGRRGAYRNRYDTLGRLAAEQALTPDEVVAILDREATL